MASNRITMKGLKARSTYDTMWVDSFSLYIYMYIVYNMGNVEFYYCASM